MVGRLQREDVLVEVHFVVDDRYERSLLEKRQVEAVPGRENYLNCAEMDRGLSDRNCIAVLTYFIDVFHEASVFESHRGFAECLDVRLDFHGAADNTIRQLVADRSVGPVNPLLSLMSVQEEWFTIGVSLFS